MEKEPSKLAKPFAHGADKPVVKPGCVCVRVLRLEMAAERPPAGYTLLKEAPMTSQALAVTEPVALLRLLHVVRTASESRIQVV